MSAEKKPNKARKARKAASSPTTEQCAGYAEALSLALRNTPPVRLRALHDAALGVDAEVLTYTVLRGDLGYEEPGANGDNHRGYLADESVAD